MTLTEAKKFLHNLQAKNVALLVGDADEYFIAAVDWDTDRVLVVVSYTANNHRQSKILGRFNTFDEADAFRDGLL